MYYYYYYYLKRLAMLGREREIDTLSVRRPQPTLPTYREKEEKGKIVHDYLIVRGLMLFMHATALIVIFFCRTLAVMFFKNREVSLYL